MIINKTGFTALLFLLLFASTITYSTTWVVLVGNFQFTPNNLNVTVGDTIKWQWVNDIHTTTSMTIPASAAPWDEPITQTSQTFSYPVTVAGNYHYKCTPHFPGMEGDFQASPIGIVPISGSVPAVFNLGQIYPNPFNPVTNIRVDIPRSSFVKLTVYNLLGGEVEVLVNQNLNTGSYSVDWDASKHSSGVYIYKIESAEFSDTKKMILVK
jgi:plastocyanin